MEKAPTKQSPFWSISKDELIKTTGSSLKGLSSSEAKRRREQDGPNSLSSFKEQTSFGLFLNQFKSPIILILLFAAFLSLFLGEVSNTLIIFL